MRRTHLDKASMDDVREQDAPDISTASEDYATRFAGTTGAWFLKVQEQAVMRMLDPDRGITILDVGGGHIQLAEPMRRAGYAMTLHGSAETCRARASAHALTRDCPFIVSPALQLPVAARAFHTVVSVRMLAHVAAWEALIAEYCRVADRAIIVDYPNAGGLNRIAPALFGAKQRIERNTRHWQAFEPGQVEAAFARHGFDVVASYRQFFMPMVLYRAMRCQPLAALVEGGCRLAGLTRAFGSPVVLKLERRASAGA
ncbi:MAG: class I SAM-dependent methyltransferase [Lentisphaerae bacterium]|nr:class I SAM-dependent methyltransferase [Lentisphaerota bacterium]